MADKTIPFVINDRRKFNTEGELRPESEVAPPAESEATPHTPPPAPQAEFTEEHPSDPQVSAEGEEDLPPALTPEQIEQARVAYEATAERLDIAIRSANPGMDHPPAPSFSTLVQSLYMQSILQLGGGTPEGEQPRVDILGARQSIDLLTVLAEKTTGQLTEPEQRLIESALFELRLAFLEITQAVARSAQVRATQAPPPGVPGANPFGAPPPGGPRIVR